MRSVVLTVLIAAAALPVQGADFETIQNIDLTHLVASPQAYQSSRIRFQATFVEVGTIYDVLGSHFGAERYLNLIVWDVGVKAWDGDARAKPVHSIYCLKDSAVAAAILGLAKYQQIEIEGRVAAFSNGLPWIEVSSVIKVPNAGAWSDQSIRHVEQGLVFAKDAIELADEHFAAATASELPPVALARVGHLRGQALVDAGRSEAAIPVINRAIADAGKLTAISAEERARLHVLLGRAIVATAKDPSAYALAADAARQAILLDPAISESYSVLGLALAGQGKLDEARLQCDRAIRLRPQDAEVRLAMGGILDQQGRHDEAIEALGKAIDLTPKDARIHFAKAVALANRGRAGGPEAATDLLTAIKECDITLRLDPRRDEAHAIAAKAIETAFDKGLELGRQPVTRAAAIERWKLALVLKPENAEATTAIARLGALELTDLEAKDDNAGILKLISAETTDPSRRLARTWALLGSGQAAEFRAAAAKLPAGPTTAEAQGWSAYLGGEFTTAESLLRTAVIADPAVKSWRLGMAVYRQGAPRFTEANELLTAAVGVKGRPSLTAGAAADISAALEAIALAKAQSEAAKKAEAEQLEAAAAVQRQTAADADAKAKADAMDAEAKAKAAEQARATSELPAVAPAAEAAPAPLPPVEPAPAPPAQP